MSRSLRILPVTLIIAVAAVFSAHAYRHTPNESAVVIPSRTFEFTYQVHVPSSPGDSSGLHLWIPLPQADAYQEIRNLRIESPVRYREGHDSEYGNSFAEFAPTPQQSSSGFDVTLSFVAVRREHKVSLMKSRATNPLGARGTPERELRRYLEPDTLVPLNGTIAELAAEQTAGDADTLAKARHIYDYVVATLRYDKPEKDGGGATPSGLARRSAGTALIFIRYSLE